MLLVVNEVLQECMRKVGNCTDMQRKSVSFVLVYLRSSFNAKFNAVSFEAAVQVHINNELRTFYVQP